MAKEKSQFVEMHQAQQAAALNKIPVDAMPSQLAHARSQLHAKISALVREPYDILVVPTEFVAYVHAFRAIEMMSAGRMEVVEPPKEEIDKNE
mgnify:CR=1 FL=1